MLQRRQLLAFGFLLILGVSGGYPAHAQDLPLDAKAKGLAHYISAVCHDLNGEASLAVSEYEKSIAYNNKESAPHLRLGAYYLRLGRLDQATASLKTVVALSPRQVQAYYLLALVYSSQKKFDLAAASYEHILQYAAQSDPNNIEIYMYLAQLYFSQRKYPQAIEQFTKIIALRPDNISAHFLLGSIYVDTQARPQAMEEFRKVLTLEPDHDGALNALGYMYAEDGVRLDEAVKMIRKAIATDPSNGAYYDSLGLGLYKQGLFAEALMALQKAESYTTDPLIYEHMGDVYKATGENALARKFWRKSLELDAHQPSVAAKIDELGRPQAFKKEK